MRRRRSDSFEPRRSTLAPLGRLDAFSAKVEDVVCDYESKYLRSVAALSQSAGDDEDATGDGPDRSHRGVPPDQQPNGSKEA